MSPLLEPPPAVRRRRARAAPSRPAAVASAATFEWDAAGVLTAVSPGLTALTGCRPTEVIGRPWREAFYADDPAGAENLQRALEAGHVSRHRSRWPGAGAGVAVEVTATRLPGGGAVGFAVPVTPEPTPAPVFRETDRLRALTGVFLCLPAAPDKTEMLRLLTEQARELLPSHQAATSLTTNGNHAQAIHAVSLSDRYAAWRNYDARPDGSGIYSLVCRENRPLRMTQAELEAHPAWRGFGTEAGAHPPLRGWLAAPLVASDGRNLGLIQLSDPVSGEYTQEDEALLCQLTRFASAVLERCLYDERLAAYAHILGMVAEGCPLVESLSEIARAVGREYPEIAAAVWLTDEHGLLQPAAAPDLPPALLRELKPVPPEAVGDGRGCGRAWKGHARTAAAAGFHLCRRVPVHGAEGLLGALLLYRNAPGDGGGTQYDLGYYAQLIRIAVLRYGADAALRASEERYLHLLQTAREGVWLLDADDRTQFANEHLAQILGVAVEDLIGRSCFEFVFPEDLEAARHKAAGRRRGEAETFDFRLRRPDGTPAWVMVASSPMFHDDGRYAGVLRMVTDISERKRAEIELRESRSLLQATLDAMENHIAILDETGVILAVNESWKEFAAEAGMPAETGGVGWNYLDFCRSSAAGGDPDAHDCLMGLLRVLRGGEASFRHEYPRDTPGEHRWYSVTARRFAVGGAVRAVVVHRNVTARHLAIQALRGSEERYRTLAEAMPQIVWTTSPSGDVTYISEHWGRFTGDPEGAPLGQGWLFCLHPEDRPRAEEAWARAVRTGEAYSIEYRLHRHDGAYRWHLAQGTPIRDPAGAITHWIGTCTDIDDQRRWAEMLRESEGRNRAVIEAAIIGAFVVQDGVIRYANPMVAQMFGYPSPTALEGAAFPDAVAADGFEDLLRGWARQVQQGRNPGPPFEWRGVRREGGEFWVRFGGRRHTWEDRPATLLFLQDVTAQRSAAEALRESEERYRSLADALERRVAEQTAELRATNAELEAFAYSVSHDLRAPLRAIDGFSQRLAQECGDAIGEGGRHYLERVRAGCRRMGSLIDDLLDLSRVTRAEMQRETVDLSALARVLDDEIRAAEPERHTETRIQAGVQAEGDRRLLRILLWNLLSNAWKFTARRTPARIEFGVDQRDGRPVYLVRDNGAGFDPQFSAKLFGPFQRLHGVSEFPGNGIGLATVQRIVHRHGGEVWAEAAVDEGATFYFTLAPPPEDAP